MARKSINRFARTRRSLIPAIFFCYLLTGVAFVACTFGVLNLFGLFSLSNRSEFINNSVSVLLLWGGSYIIYFIRQLFVQVIAQRYDESLSQSVFTTLLEERQRDEEDIFSHLGYWCDYSAAGGQFIVVDAILAVTVWPVVLYYQEPLHGIVLGLGAGSIAFILFLNAAWLHSSVRGMLTTRRVNTIIQANLRTIRFPRSMMQIARNMVRTWLPTHHVERHSLRSIHWFGSASSAYLGVCQTLVVMGYIGVSGFQTTNESNLIVSIVFCLLTFGVLIRTSNHLYLRSLGVHGARTLNRETADQTQSDILPASSMGLSGIVSTKNLNLLHPVTSEPLVRGLSFLLESSTITGVVGPNLSGKTLVAKTLANLWPYFEGDLQFDRESVHKWDKLWLDSNIGYMPQELDLLSGTVGQNVSRFERAQHDELIVAALSTAGVLPFFEARKEKWHGPLFDDRGSIYPHSILKRLAFARAVYRDPRIVILDEPLAGLDQHNADSTISAIQALRQSGKTVILCFSSSSLIDICDNLLLMQNGEVLIQGESHEVLAKLKPAVQTE